MTLPAIIPNNAPKAPEHIFHKRSTAPPVIVSCLTNSPVFDSVNRDVSANTDRPTAKPSVSKAASMVKSTKAVYNPEPLAIGLSFIY